MPASIPGPLGVLVAGIVRKAVGEHRLIAADSQVGYVHYIRKHLTPRQHADEIIQLNLSGRAVRSGS